MSRATQTEMPWVPVQAAPGAPPLPFTPALWTTFVNIFPDVFDPPGRSVLGMLCGNETSQLMQRALLTIVLRGQYRQRFMLPMNGATSPSAGEVGAYTRKSRTDFTQAKMRAAADLVSIFGWPVETGGAIDPRADLVDDLPLRILLHLCRLAGRRLSADLWVSNSDGNTMLTRIERARSDQYLPLRMRQARGADQTDITLSELEPESADGATTIAAGDEPVEWLIFGRSSMPNSPLYMYTPPPSDPADRPILRVLSAAERRDVYTAAASGNPRSAEALDATDSFALPVHPRTGLPVTRAGQGFTRIRDVVQAQPMRFFVPSSEPDQPPEEVVDINVQALFHACDSAWVQTGRGPASGTVDLPAGQATLQMQLQEMLEHGGQSSDRVEMDAAQARVYAQGILLVVRILQDNMTSVGWRALHHTDESGFGTHFPAVPDDLSEEDQAAVYGPYLWNAITNTNYPADETFTFLCSMASSWGDFSFPIKYQIVHANWFTNLIPELDSHLNSPLMPGSHNPHSVVWIRAIPLENGAVVWSTPLIFSRYNASDAAQWLLAYSKIVPDQPIEAMRVHDFQRRRGAAAAKVAWKAREYQVVARLKLLSFVSIHPGLLVCLSCGVCLCRDVRAPCESCPMAHPLPEGEVASKAHHPRLDHHRLRRPSRPEDSEGVQAEALSDHHPSKTWSATSLRSGCCIQLLLWLRPLLHDSGPGLVLLRLVLS